MNVNRKFVTLLAAGVAAASTAGADLVTSSIADQEADSNGGVGALGNSSILAGAYYGVETKDNLVSGDWAPITNGLLGTGGLIPVTNSINQDRIFYRVIGG